MPAVAEIVRRLWERQRTAPTWRAEGRHKAAADWERRGQAQGLPLPTAEAEGRHKAGPYHR